MSTGSSAKFFEFDKSKLGGTDILRSPSDTVPHDYVNETACIRLRFWCDVHGYVDPDAGTRKTEISFDRHGELTIHCPLCFEPRPMAIERFTGEYDANDTPIFENDIVDYCRFHGESFTPEKRKRRVITWQQHNRCIGFNFRPTTNDGAAQWVVAGNIREDPDMVPT